MENVKETIQPLGSMPLWLARKKKSKQRTSATSNAIPANKRVTMRTSDLKIEKTSCRLDKLHIDDCQENREARMDTLYPVSRNLQGSDQGTS